jgi:hypothetical protein
VGFLTDEDGLRQLAKILPKITPVFEVAMTSMKTPDRKGAAVTIINIDKETMFSFTTFVGTPAFDKKEKYWNLSMEKVELLISFPKLLSTFQKRDPSKERWGGGIKTEHLAIGVSGFSEHWDEAIALVLPVVVGVMTFEQAEYITTFSNNRLFKPLFDAVPALQ